MENFHECALTGLLTNCQTVLFMPQNGLFQKKTQTDGVEDILFWKPPGNFRFVTLRIEIPEKTSFPPWKFWNIVWHHLEIPRSKTKTNGNSTSFSWRPLEKFHFFFNWTLKFPHALFNYPWKYHVLNLPPVFFFWNNPMQL